VGELDSASVRLFTVPEKTQLKKQLFAKPRNWSLTKGGLDPFSNGNTESDELMQLAESFERQKSPIILPNQEVGYVAAVVCSEYATINNDEKFGLMVLNMAEGHTDVKCLTILCDTDYEAFELV
jgi:hypothetical protein